MQRHPHPVPLPGKPPARLHGCPFGFPGDNPHAPASHTRGRASIKQSSLSPQEALPASSWPGPNEVPAPPPPARWQPGCPHPPSPLSVQLSTSCFPSGAAVARGPGTPRTCPLSTPNTATRISEGHCWTRAPAFWLRHVWALRTRASCPECHQHRRFWASEHKGRLRGR